MNTSKLKTRNDKVNFLKGLNAGTRSVDEITGNTGISIWYQHGVGGLISGEGGQVSEDELRAFQQRYPKKHYIVFRPQPGNEPLAD